MQQSVYWLELVLWVLCAVEGWMVPKQNLSSGAELEYGAFLPILPKLRL